MGGSGKDEVRNKTEASSGRFRMAATLHGVPDGAVKTRDRERSVRKSQGGRGEKGKEKREGRRKSTL